MNEQIDAILFDLEQAMLDWEGHQVDDSHEFSVTVDGHTIRYADGFGGHWCISVASVEP